MCQIHASKPNIVHNKPENLLSYPYLTSEEIEVEDRELE